MAVFETKKKPKQEVNGEMVDQILEDTKRQKNFKEKMYDKVNLPVWVLDVLIAVLLITFVAVIFFGRGTSGTV